MERALEGTIPVEAGPERVTQILSCNPADVLTGLPSVDQGAFVAEMTVELGGGTSLAHEVDVVFGRRPDAGAVGRFALSWRARDHEGAFPVFEGELEVHPDGHGSQLRLSGHYSLPLGPVGAFGDRLLGHRVARRSIHAFMEAAAARIDAAVAREAEAGASAARPPTADVTVTVDAVPSELYLG